ncbi:hypothetical protein [Kineosporia sp. A_224]|uniref:hypothetical protein n=1 Tax=Kineosporia sp. A_224 TaxID=1962180 RepID=UPI00117ACBF3|nr:hypothetical protein [Kineosporia sp. A_224]
MGGVEDLARLTARGSDLDRCDEVLGGLVRRAAADGGDDADAVLVLLHLLASGVATMVGRLRDLDTAGDLVTVVVGQLAVEIRQFPWQRRRRAYALSLLLDTRRAVLRELGVRRGAAAREVLVDGDLYWWESTLDAVPGPEEPGALEELADFLMWATRRRLVDADDVRLAWQLEQLHGYGQGAGVRVAQAWGVHERTARRRQARTLSALKAAAAEYAAA